MSRLPLFGVKATADAALIIYADPLVAEKTSRSDFCISDLVCLDNPRSLDIQLPPSDANRLRPLSRLILSQIATLMMEDSNTVRGLEKKRKLMMMIDEFATLGRLDCFTSWIRVMASYGLRAVLILQSDRDLADTYGPYNTISENCPVQVLFPTSDDSTLRRISTAIGNDDENRESRTYPRWFSPGKSSKSISERRRPVLEPAEIRSMPKDEQLILITTCKPVRCKKIRWWMDKPFKSRGINTFEGGTAPPQHPAILKMAQAAQPPEAVPAVEQKAQELDQAAIAASAIPRVEHEGQTPDEIDTASTSTIPQYQDNPLAAVVDRIGWTKAQAARHLFPAENSRTVQRWITGARRLPDEHIPFIAYLLAITTKRAESKTTLQAWLLSIDADRVSLIERLRNGEIIEDET
jgi:type IV secretion system protein VirD4